MYSVLNPMTNDLVKAAFESVYSDISVEFVRLSGGELEQRADAEREGGLTGPDVIVGSNTEWFRQLASEGQLLDAVGDHSTALAEGEFSTGDGQVLMMSAGAFGYAWNTDAVEGEIEFLDILDERFDGGRVATYDVNISPSFALWNYVTGEEYGMDFAAELAAIDPTVFPSGTPMLQALAAGQVDVVVYAAKASIPPGSPIEIRFPDRPISTPFWAALPGWGDNPNAGQVFLDWVASPEGQEVWAADQASVLEDVSTALFFVGDTSLADPADHDPAFIEAEAARQRELFN